MDTTKQMDEKLDFLCRKYKVFLEKLLAKVVQETFRTKLQTVYDIVTKKSKAPSMAFVERVGETLKGWEQRKQSERNTDNKLLLDIKMLEQRLTKLKSEALESDSMKTINDESGPSKIGNASKVVKPKQHVICPLVDLVSDSSESDDDDVQFVSEETQGTTREIEDGEIVDDNDNNSNSSSQSKALTKALEHNVIKSDSMNNTADLRSSPVLVPQALSAAKELTTISPTITTSTISTSSVALITSTMLATALKSVDISINNHEHNIQTREDINRNNETSEENTPAKGSEKLSTTRNESQFLPTEEELVSNNKNKIAPSNPENSETTEVTTSLEKVTNLEKNSGLENEDDALQTVYEIISEDENNSPEKLTTPADYSEMEKASSTDGKTNGSNESSNIAKNINDHLSDISSEEEKETAPDVYMELIHRIDNSNVTNTEKNEADEENLLEAVTGEKSIENNSINISNNQDLEVPNEIILSNDENHEHSKSECDEILDIYDKDTQNFLEKLDAELSDPKECTSKVEDHKKKRRKCKRRKKSKRSCDINKHRTDSNQRNVKKFEVETGRTNYLGNKKYCLQNSHLSPKKCLDDLRKFGIENPKSPKKTKVIQNLMEPLHEPEKVEGPKKNANKTEVIVIEDDMDNPSKNKIRNDRKSLHTMELQQDVINITDDELDVNGIYDGDELIGTRRAKPREPTTKDDEAEIVLEIPLLHGKNSETIVDAQTASENNELSSQSNEGPKEFVENVGSETNEKNQNLQENEEDKENEIPNSPNKEDSSKGTVETLSNTDCGNTSSLIDNWEDKSLDELQKLRITLEREFGINLNDVFASVNSGELEDSSDLSDQLLSSVPEPEHNVQMPAQIQHFGELSHPVMISQSIPPPQPVPPPDVVNWSQFQNIPYLSSNIQNSSQLSPYLGLPQGIKPNDPRLGNRLRLLYDKTTEPQRLQIPTSRIPQLPYPSDVLGAKADAVQHEIRSVCLKEIDPTTSTKDLQNTQQNRSNCPTLSKNNQVRSYAEYRKLKMEAAARKQATIDAANKALQSQNLEKSEITKKRKSNELELINTDVSDGKENTGNLSSSESDDDQIKHRSAKKPRVIRSSSDENQDHDEVWSVFSETPKSANNKTLHTLKLRKVSTESDVNGRRGSKSSEESEKKDSTISSNDQELLQNLNAWIDSDVSMNERYKCVLQILKPVVSVSEFESIQQILSCDTKAKPSKIAHEESQEDSGLKHTEKESKDKCTQNRNIKKGYRELEHLNRDIQSMFIRDGVLTARGRRFCSIISEKRTEYQMYMEKGNNRHKELSAMSFSNILQDTENINLPHHGDKDDETDHFELSTLPNRLKKFTKTRPKIKCSKRILQEFYERKVQVRLKRIKDNSDSALLQPLKEIPFEETVRKTRQPKSKSGKNILIYNTNPEHNIRSKYMEKCILCPKTSKNMVEHYRNSHPKSEVFISRLHSNDLDYITKNPFIATPISGQKGYQGDCLFCDEEIRDRFSNFYHHFSSHTGEFGYECRECGLEKSCKTEIVDHCTRQCKKDAKWRKLFSYRKGISKINAFVCSKCNYIQLNRIHVTQHLEQQHNVAKPTDSDIEIITLMQKIDTDERTPDITIANEPVLYIKTDEIDIPNDSERTISQTDKEKYENKIAEEVISIKTEIELYRVLESTINQASVAEAVEKLYNEDNTIMTVIPATDNSENVDVKPSIEDLQKSVENFQNEKDNSEIADVKPSVENFQQSVGNLQNKEDKTGSIEVNSSKEKSVQDLQNKEGKTGSIEINSSMEKCVQGLQIEEQTMHQDIQIANNAQNQDENSPDDLDNVNYLRSDLDCMELLLSDESMNNNCSKQTSTNTSETKSVSPTSVLSNTEGDRGIKDNETANEMPANSNDWEMHDETEEAVRSLKIIQDDERSNDLDDSAPKLVIDLFEETENRTQGPSKTTPFDIGKISMIENLGFGFIGSSHIFFCKPHLTFSNLKDLREYVAITQKSWSGRCETCNSIGSEHANGLSLATELKHLLNTHLKINTTVTSAQAEHNSVNNPSVMNENLNFVIKHLKPWLDRTISNKSKMLCENMSSQKSLCRFFKCMGDDCCFAAITETEMLSHIYKHNITWREESTPKSWLECSYCDYISTTEVTLLHHIKDIHKTSKFQCSLCFYRSCHAYNVSIHIKMCHSTSSNAAILDCPGPMKSLQSELEIMNKIKTNVRPILCEVCKIEFFVIDSLANHMKSAHNLKIDSAKIGMFACIYCSFEVNNIFFMREHMANKHPSELLYTCARLNNPNVALKGTENLSVKENCCLVFVGETVDKNLFRKCLYTDAELNFSKYFEDVIDLTILSNGDASKGALNRDNNVKIAEQLGIITYEQFRTILNESENKEMETTKSISHSELKILVKRSKRIFAKKSPFLYKCIIPNCQEALKDLRSWELHVGCHMNESCEIKYRCPYCPKEHSIKDFSEHISRHEFIHYFCYYCGEIFQTVAESENHLKTNHSLDKPKFLDLPKEFNTVRETTPSSIDTHDNYIVLSGPVVSTLVIENFTMVLRNRLGPKKDNKSRTHKPTESNMVQFTKNNSKILDMINKDTPKFVLPNIRFTCGVDSCKDILSGDVSLCRHLEEKHNKPNQFQCAHCLYSIDYPGHAIVREHFKCHGKIIYVCCFCDFVSTAPIDINRHLNKSHKSMSYYLVSERMEHNSIRRIEMVHNKKPEGITKSCLFCDKVMNYSEMLLHVRTDHDLQLLYRCNYCQFEKWSYEEVVKHLETLHKKPFRMKEIYFLLNTVEGVHNIGGVSKSFNEITDMRTENLSATANYSLHRKRTASANNELEISEPQHTCAKLKKAPACTILYCPKCSHMLESEQLLTEHMSQLHGLPLTASTTSNYFDKNQTIQEDQISGIMNNNTLIASTTPTHDSNLNRNDLVINIENSVSQTKPVVNVTVSFMNKDTCESVKAGVSCIPSSSIAEPSQKHPEIRLVPISKLLREDLKSKIPQPIVTNDIMVVDSDDEFIDIQAITTDFLHNSNESNVNQSTQPMQSAQSQSACISTNFSRSISNEIEFHCFYCQVKHMDIQEVFKHWQNVHKHGGYSFKYYILQLNNAFLTQAVLIQLLKLGPKTSVLHCSDCAYKCYAVSVFKTHAISAHGCSKPPVIIPQRIVSYGCSICKSTHIFENEKTAVKHIYKFHTQFHLCTFCLGCFPSYNYLKQHCITMHGTFNETAMLQRLKENFLVYNNMYVFFTNGFSAHRSTLKNTTYGNEENLRRLIDIVENEN